MKYILSIFGIFFLISCSNKNEIKSGKLAPSFGARNHITVVIEDELWNGEVGDSIRKHLAKIYFNLDKEEPIFNLDQYSPSIFNSKAKASRNIVMFSNTDEYSFTLEKSFYATPQNLFFVRGKNNQELIENFNKHADSIVSVFRNSELNEEQHAIVRNEVLNSETIKTLFACTIKIPKTFQMVLKEENFMWFQKDLPSGNSNLIIYEVPISEIENKKNDVASNLIKVQDSISKIYVKGTAENSYMITERSFFPFFKPTKIQQLPALEIKGIWEMENDFMSGPFLTFAVKDEYYDRYLILQAFVNNPYKTKRDLLFETEAIIKTLNFFENEN